MDKILLCQSLNTQSKGLEGFRDKFEAWKFDFPCVLYWRVLKCPTYKCRYRYVNPSYNASISIRFPITSQFLH